MGSRQYDLSISFNRASISQFMKVKTREDLLLLNIFARTGFVYVSKTVCKTVCSL